MAVAGFLDNAVGVRPADPLPQQQQSTRPMLLARESSRSAQCPLIRPRRRGRGRCRVVMLVSRLPFAVKSMCLVGAQLMSNQS